MEDDEPHVYVSSPERASARGVMLTLLLAFGIFGVSTGSARFFFPQGASGRPPREAAAKDDAATVGAVLAKESTEYTTKECAGNAKLPVLKGVDVVSYFSLIDGEPAMFGFEEFESVFNGYRFLFTSEENKALFEVSCEL